MTQTNIFPVFSQFCLCWSYKGQNRSKILPFIGLFTPKKFEDAFFVTFPKNGQDRARPKDRLSIFMLQTLHFIHKERKEGCKVSELHHHRTLEYSKVQERF